MVLLQPRLNLKVTQRQVLTPALMQMVSVLALNKLELKEMIHAEMVENPVLEEIDESVPLLDEVEARQQQLDQRTHEPESGTDESAAPTKDPFDEIDFGSYFQEYLDPGFRIQREYEEIEKPSFENFLSQPTTLADHLAWQLGALTLDPSIHAVAEFIIGNLDENGYLPLSETELAEMALDELGTNEPGTDPKRSVARAALRVVQGLDPTGIAAHDLRECLLLQISAQLDEFEHLYALRSAQQDPPESILQDAESQPSEFHDPLLHEGDLHGGFQAAAEQMLAQRRDCFDHARRIVEQYLPLLQKNDPKELSRALGLSVDQVHAAVEFIRTLDPRPGSRYNQEQTRLIEPDVAFVKRGDTWVVALNEEDLPSLRLSHQYRRMLVAEGTEKDVRDYVKERFRSALQLMRNIAQRKSTILRTCEVIVRRQQDFLDLGIEALRPMMIKEVAEEIGVHPSTVSRAVANKYAHTPQGVLELRFFFTEGSNGPEGADTPLVVLKRKVRKLIEDENPAHPLTDDQLATLLQAQGIQVTRRTVAKYREGLNIPPTHQRRRRI